MQPVKKWFSWLFSACLAFSLTACTPDSGTSDALHTATLAPSEVTLPVPSPVSSPENSAPLVSPEASAFPTTPASVTLEPSLLDEFGTYSSMEDVSLYLATYGELPDNFITKQEARDLGWTGGSLEPYAPGSCIGGDYFGNYEGILPQPEGRTFHECDIDTLGTSSRGAKRLVFSNDGLIYYTDDHYQTFTLLYGDEDETDY